MIKGQSISVIIVKKDGSLQNLTIKDYKEEELFKKCGFKKADGFKKHTEWKVKHDGIDYGIIMYGKDKGRANNENKYEFPPPIDTTLFFGSCCLVAVKMDVTPVNLTLPHWKIMYEKLFGGFEDLTRNDTTDDEDEMKHIPKEKQTKSGYLKDEFVVDDTSDSEESDETLSETELSDGQADVIDNTSEQYIIEDIGSELSEESYDTE